jgi:hypothetical protein
MEKIADIAYIIWHVAKAYQRTKTSDGFLIMNHIDDHERLAKRQSM